MEQQNKLTFGVHLTTSTTLVIASGPKRPMPDMFALSSAGPTEYKSYDEEAHHWSFPLAAGDYVVRLLIEDECDETLAITTAAPVLLVYYGPVSGDTTVAWSTASATSGNPKDPWPPPSNPYVTLPSASFAWFDAQLRALQMDPPPPRSGRLV